MANYNSASVLSGSIQTFFASNNSAKNTGVDGAFVTLQPNETVIIQSGSSLSPIFRGFLGGSYVTQVGSPPAGAQFINIIGFI